MSRRGYTLVEMIVAMTIGTVIVGISVGMLHLLLRTERMGRDRVPQTRILARLAEQFRNDVAAAVRQTHDARQTEWWFTLTGDRVANYRLLPGAVQRHELLADKPVRQESYVLPSGCSARIVMEEAHTPAVVNLVIMGATGAASASSKGTLAEPVAPEGMSQAAGREMRVVAVLGKDHRFTKSPVGSQ
jgi:prepilin-type N-terminal cleavage/methylation domain-containing protein